MEVDHMGEAASRTTRELRTSGAAAILLGLLYLAVPGVPADCWVSARVLPAVPIVAIGIIMIALGGRSYAADLQTDEADRLRAQIASAHDIPAATLPEAGRPTGRRWTVLPFVGLFLVGLALSTLMRGLDDCTGAPSSSLGAAAGFAITSVVAITLGLRRYRQQTAAGAASIEALRQQAQRARPPAGP
jgi:hypothetical protein